MVVWLAGAVDAGAQVTPQQSAALTRALQQETNGQLRESAASYREALTQAEMVPALLGLERVYAQLRWTDSLVPIVDSVVARNPTEPVSRTMQLRVLRSLKRDAQARAAYRDWVRAAPGDVSPYREWARLLLADGRTAEADSVLQDAQEAVGSATGLLLETAQLRAALGQWDSAAIAWRQAITRQDYLESAAEFSLRGAPADVRRVVRSVMLAAPVEKSPRRLLAMLELDWGSGRDGWLALRDLPPGDSTAAAWITFADEAERRGQWLSARDALLALQQWHPDAQRVLRAATLAIDGGDPESALKLAAQAADQLGPRDGPKTVLSIRLQAFVKLGRGAEAQRAYESVQSQLGTAERDAARRSVAWAWVRGGGVAEARAVLGGATPDPDDELTGWLALYDGDLAGARRGLRRADARTGDAALAFAFATRTKLERAPLAGAAFLLLARGDTVKAAAAFVRASSEVTDAASLLLLTAARLHHLQRRDSAAVGIWTVLVGSHATTPEAAEAELEWARVLRLRGERTAAITHLEHLILSWPDSALLPQARRELELARGAIPGDTIHA